MLNLLRKVLCRFLRNKKKKTCCTSLRLLLVSAKMASMVQILRQPCALLISVPTHGFIYSQFVHTIPLNEIYIILIMGVQQNFFIKYTQIVATRRLIHLGLLLLSISCWYLWYGGISQFLDNISMKHMN